METIIGIDFGTTNSEVAVYENGVARVVPGSNGQRMIPSAVYIDETGKRYVGEAAKNVAILHPDRTVKSVKRLLATGRCFRFGEEELGPEEIASFIFQALKEMAERYLGRDVCKAVVTVPAYFDDPRRQATRRAAAMAGLDVVRLVNEPTAAALAYGVDSRQEGNILVFDLGGGTFDVSILRIGGGVFHVAATRGDIRLGGDDFDRLLAEFLLERFMEETDIDVREDRLAMQKVFQAAEEAKIRLSEWETADVEVPFIAVNRQGPCHLVTRISRVEFEGLITAHVEKTLRLTRGALQDAGLRPQEVDRVLLVGGSTRIPMLRRAVESYFCKTVDAGTSPEEIVACGAAVQGSILAGEERQLVLVDVTPLGLGVETQDARMVTLVPRNTVLPAQSSALFTTVADYQKSACIKVIQGERRRAEDNVFLGSFRLESIQQAHKGEPNIEICFEIDVEGIVHVSARDMKTKSSSFIELNGVNNLSDEQVKNTLLEAEAAELEDIFTAG